MTNEEIDVLWLKAMKESIEAGESFTRYRFAELVADAEAKRLEEKGFVTVGHMQERIAAERDKAQQEQLTEERIEDIWEAAACHEDDTLNIIEFARDIEAAHGIAKARGEK